MSKKENLQALIKGIYHVSEVSEEQEVAFLELLKDLTDREEKVVRLRYGLDDDIKRTYKEIGEMFDLSTSRIHQITHKAVLKLHHPARRRKVVK